MQVTLFCECILAAAICIWRIGTCALIALLTNPAAIDGGSGVSLAKDDGSLLSLGIATAFFRPGTEEASR